jgi:hypothetical protein
MAAAAADTAVVENQDLIAVFDRLNALGDDDHGRIGIFLLQGFAQSGVGLVVQSAAGIIEQKEFRLAGKSP